MRFLSRIFCLQLCISQSFAFQSRPIWWQRTSTPAGVVVFSSTSTNNPPEDDETAGSKNGGKEALNAMRMILDQSWNTETMGEIPADANIGAKEAFETIQRAHDDGVSVCFVDLLLPAYDIKQGPELYDEVMAVEYCIALSEFLDGKTQILVKDDKVRKTVSRILDAREKEKEEKAREERERAEQEAARERERLAVEAAKREAEAKREAKILEQTLAASEDDNDAEEDEQEEENDDNGDDDEEPSGESADASDLDAFRQSLMANWDLEADDADLSSEEQGDPIVDSASDKTPTEASDDASPAEGSVPAEASPSLPYVKRYRLATLFGDRDIKRGSEMMEEVVETIRLNALPQEDEKNMIILSSLSIQETVALRSLVNKYEFQKNIILVNCKLDPLPPELRSAETVYSILPMIAKQRGGPAAASSDDAKPPKVVVLRRYPKPWEVYVDIGEGFQLADSIPPTSQTSRELPLERITDSVRKWLR